MHVAGTAPQPGTGLPLGQPLAGTVAHVLDGALAPLPDGVAGELYLGGPALARGYLGRAALTADRFVPDPFSAHGGRLYRTGDRVRRQADGVFEYLGRIDDQVKIRGFRVEPCEVAAQLAALPGVRQAAVVADATPTGMQLAGYAVPEDGRRTDPAELRRALAAVLPGNMVPATIVWLDALPLTANGKLDRRALPKADAPVAVAAEPPQGDLETRLAAIWQDLLGVAATTTSSPWAAIRCWPSSFCPAFKANSASMRRLRCCLAPARWPNWLPRCPRSIAMPTKPPCWSWRRLPIPWSQSE